MTIPMLVMMAAAATSYRQPQLAAGHGMVAMVFGGGSSIYFAASQDEGRSFLPAVKVAETGSLALGRHRGPRLAILKDALVISAVAGEKEGTQAGTLMTWRSTDRGESWARAGVINDVPEAAREGLHAMSARPDGSLFAVWLDLRGKGTKLYGSGSTDGGRTWSKNVPVYESPDGTICQCCHPTLAVGEDGRIWMMWRNVMGGSRDLYVASSSDGIRFNEAVKLGDGTWKLNACPMDGGGLAVSGGQVVSAWRREGDLFLAAAGQPEKKIGSGKDVALARTARGAYAAWTGKDGSMQLMRPVGAAPETLAPEGAFVTLQGLGDGSVLAAWEQNGKIESRRIDSR